MSGDQHTLVVSVVAVAVFMAVVYLSNPVRLARRRAERERRRHTSRWWTRPPS